MYTETLPNQFHNPRNTGALPGTGAIQDGNSGYPTAQPAADCTYAYLEDLQSGDPIIYYEYVRDEADRAES